MKGSADRRVDDAAALGVLRPPVRMDARARTRSLGRPDRHRRVPRQERRFDQAITDFSERYADQNERDYEEFTKAIRSGRLAATEGV